MSENSPWLDHPLFAALFRATPDLIFIHGPDGRIVDVNPQVERVLGWSREEFINLPPERFMPEGYDAAEAFARLERARNGEPQDFPWVARAKCGEEIPVEVRLRPLPLPEPGYVLALVHDQRLQHDSRQAHEKRRDALRRIAEAERSSLDPDRILHHVIDAVREMFQADRAYLVHPLDPNANRWSVPVQSSAPAYAATPGGTYPYTARTRHLARAILAANGALPLYPTEEDNEWGAERYQIRSSLALAIRPRLGAPWLLGIHQCGFPRRWTQAEQALFTELGERIAPLLDALTEQRQREEQEDRLSRFQRILAELARVDPAQAHDLHHALRPYSAAAAQALGVQRASVWLLDPQHQALRCEDLYQNGHHRHGEILRAGLYPAYFAALEEGRTIAAGDAQRDPRTADFLRSYLLPQHIGAVLDAPIRVAGEVVGVLRCEQCHAPRAWASSEQAFAASLADQLALVVDYWHHREAEQRLAEQARFAQRLLCEAPIGYLLLDDRGRVLEANPSAAALLGYEKTAALEGRPFPLWPLVEHHPGGAFELESPQPLRLELLPLERGGQTVTAVFLTRLGISAPQPEKARRRLGK